MWATNDETGGPICLLLTTRPNYLDQKHSPMGHHRVGMLAAWPLAARAGAREYGVTGAITITAARLSFFF